MRWRRRFSASSPAIHSSPVKPSSSTAVSARRRSRAVPSVDGVVPFPPEFAARYRAAGYWEDRTLDDVFSGLFAEHAERIALLHAGEMITYRQLGERRATLAARLHDMGLRRHR